MGVPLVPYQGCDEAAGIQAKSKYILPGLARKSHDLV